MTVFEKVMRHLFVAVALTGVALGAVVRMVLMALGVQA